MAGTKFWDMQVRAATPQVGEVYLYGPISSVSWWGDEVTPQAFKQELDALGDITDLHVYINSAGGDVFAGHAIHSMLKRHKATVTVHVDGLAASIASVIAMAGDVVVMPRNAMMMVHNPWIATAGNSEELRKMADDLDMIAKSLIAAYQDKTGLPEEDIRALMDAETWLTAEDCVNKGFANELEADKQIAASLRGDILNIAGREFDLSKFGKRPAGLAAEAPPAPQGPPPDAAPVSPAPAPSVQNAGRVLSSENESHIRSAHEALGKVLDKLGADDPPPDDASAAADPPPEPAANSITTPASPASEDGGEDVKARNVACLETLKAQIETRRRR